MSEAHSVGAEVHRRIQQRVRTMRPHRAEPGEIPLSHLLVRSTDRIAMGVDDRCSGLDASQRLCGYLVG